MRVPIGEVGLGNCHEGAQCEAVGKDGVDVAWEELGGGEEAAVDGLGEGWGEAEDGDVMVEGLAVGVDGLDEDRGVAESGVRAFLREEVDGGLIGALRRHVHVLRALLSAPLLHLLHQLSCNT